MTVSSYLCNIFWKMLCPVPNKGLSRREACFCRWEKATFFEREVFSCRLLVFKMLNWPYTCKIYESPSQLYLPPFPAAPRWPLPDPSSLTSPLQVSIPITSVGEDVEKSDHLSLLVLQPVKQRASIWPRNSIPSYRLQRTKTEARIVHPNRD